MGGGTRQGSLGRAVWAGQLGRLNGVLREISPGIGELETAAREDRFFVTSGAVRLL